MKISLHSLLEQLGGRLSRRQARLAACACVRRLIGAGGGSGVEAVELAERFADGHATAYQLASARFGGRFRPGHAAWAVCWDPQEDPVAMMERALAWVAGVRAGMNAVEFRKELVAQAELLLEIAAPLLDPVALDPAWLVWGDATVVKLARATYDGRDFAQMPILGYALEEAGCSDARVLDHCRGKTEHVRGCWLLDRLLGLS